MRTADRGACRANRVDGRDVNPAYCDTLLVTPLTVIMHFWVSRQRRPERITPFTRGADESPHRRRMGRGRWKLDR
jgi:hypothetical protein